MGDLINTKTRLLNCLGSTECGLLPTQLCAPECNCISLRHECRHFSADLYEHVIVRDPKLQLYQGVFETFGELIEWPMKDLYSKYPIKEDRWLY